MRSTDPRIQAIVAAAAEVYRELGTGFFEPVYHDALKFEFTKRNVPFRYAVVIPVHYKDILLPSKYKADFVCYGNILVEIDAAKEISSLEDVQILNALRAIKMEVGMLINFGMKTLRCKQFATVKRPARRTTTKSTAKKT